MGIFVFDAFLTSVDRYGMIDLITLNLCLLQGIDTNVESILNFDKASCGWVHNFPTCHIILALLISTRFSAFDQFSTIWFYLAELE